MQTKTFSYALLVVDDQFLVDDMSFDCHVIMELLVFVTLHDEEGFYIDVYLFNK